ncbi:MAG TPA: hypothetical protein VGD40_05435 [Chryseosolibacter sp.]
MITKVYALLVMIGGIAVALIVSYYLNIRVDYKAVLAYLRSKV